MTLQKLYSRSFELWLTVVMMLLFNGENWRSDERKETFSFIMHTWEEVHCRKCRYCAGKNLWECAHQNTTRKTQYFKISGKSAVSFLLKSPNSDSFEKNNVLKRNTVRERLEKLMKGHPSSHDFPDLQSILGSAAKVKRLWSVDKQVTTGVRSLMFPSISETFIFLKANVRSRMHSVYQRLFILLRLSIPSKRR